jgi:WD40 repeat protein
MLTGVAPPPVHSVPSQLFVPRHWLQRLDCKALGCPAGVLCPCLHWSSGHRVHARDEPRREIHGQRRFGALLGSSCSSETDALSPVTGEDLAINLWDLGSGKRIKKMTGHTASIYSLAFSAESSLLVSGGADWTVRCWDVKAAGGLPNKAKENGVGEADQVNGVDDSIET